MSTPRPIPDSKHPIIAEINALVYKTYPPKLNHDGDYSHYTYGSLYYYGDSAMVGVIGEADHLHLHPTWILDGMTPVGEDYVLKDLERHGHDVAKFRAFFADLDATRGAHAKQRAALRASAALKLTPEERTACDLD